MAKLQAFAAAHGLRTSSAVLGYVSGGSQEIAVLFDPDRVGVRHRPGGTAGSSNPKFDEEFRADADGDGIDELYRHYRPPLEAVVTVEGLEVRLIVVHAKSKGIFDSVDLVQLDRVSERNRRKLFAEALSIRRRVEQHLAAGAHVVVMGDVNDGPGMDEYEMRFGRSAVEIIMGDIFEPSKLLVSHSGRPVFGRFGWEPASARFRDRITEDHVNVLIDHVLVSQSLTVAAGGHRVWNPFTRRSGLDQHRDTFTLASDHFPVSVDIEIGA